MSNDRFVICRHKGEVSVLDTGHDLVEEEGNAELFNLDCSNETDAKILAEELNFIVRLLNEQGKELDSLDIHIP